MNEPIGRSIRRADGEAKVTGAAIYCLDRELPRMLHAKLLRSPVAAGRITRLLAKDSWESLQSLVQSRRAAIDSVATMAGVSRPGLALVTFFGQRSNARFDPQTLTVGVRNRIFRPLGIVPFSGRFSGQQLDVREQVSGIFLFEEDLPVDDSFTISYNGITSGDWTSKQRQLDRERARVALRARGVVRDTAAADSAR